MTMEPGSERHLRLSAKVEVRFGDNHRSKWVKGVIAKVQNDSIFDITYSDGTSEKGLKKDFVRLPKERAVKAKKESKASKQSQGPSAFPCEFNTGSLSPKR